MYVIQFFSYSGSTFEGFADSEAEMLDVVRIHMSSEFVKSATVTKNFD